MRFLITTEYGCLVVITRDGRHRKVYNLTNNSFLKEDSYSVVFEAKTLEEAVRRYNAYDRSFNMTVEDVREQMAIIELGA